MVGGGGGGSGMAFMAVYVGLLDHDVDEDMEVGLGSFRLL